MDLRKNSRTLRTLRLSTSRSTTTAAHCRFYMTYKLQVIIFVFLALFVPSMYGYVCASLSLHIFGNCEFCVPPTWCLFAKKNVEVIGLTSPAINYKRNQKLVPTNTRYSVNFIVRLYTLGNGDNTFDGNRTANVINWVVIDNLSSALFFLHLTLIGDAVFAWIVNLYEDTNIFTLTLWLFWQITGH